MKKFLSLILALSMLLCSAALAEETEPAFVLAYPESMKAMGYEDLVLDAVPTAIACTTTSPVLTLEAMGASLVAIPSSAATAHIDASVTRLGSIMADDFNIESVVALNPDLVIMSVGYADSHGATLESLNIPVYYLSAGHGVSYESAKAEALLIVDAFSVDAESTAKGDALKQKFADVEARVAALAADGTYAGKTMLVLQSGGATYTYAQNGNGTLASMLSMLGFENIVTTAAGSGMIAVDLELYLATQPELIVVCGAGTAEDTATNVWPAVVASNDVWNSLTAVQNNEVLPLGIDYIAIYGIGYIDALNNLIDAVAAHYAE